MDLHMFKCPRQSGNLHISKHACALRYLKAQTMSTEIPVREFDIIKKIGLEICETCPLGKRNAMELHIADRESWEFHDRGFVHQAKKSRLTKNDVDESGGEQDVPAVA